MKFSGAGPLHSSKQKGAPLRRRGRLSYAETGDRRASQVVRIWRKWLSRRDRQSVVRWARFNELLARNPLPSVKILHGYAAASESLS